MGKSLPTHKALYSVVCSSGKDDAAVTNVQFKCTDGSTFGDWSGDELDWGSWEAWKYCPKNQVVCGIQTQVEPSQGRKDDTALNGIKLTCCYY